MAPIPNRGDKRAFFDIKINGDYAGRIVFQLWNYTCPRTVENFRVMCTGEMGELYGHRASYRGAVFHRIVKGFMIQGGDITRQDGSGGFSIYGANFDDENLALKHSRPFLLSMANKGPDTNGCQFFITTDEVPHLDGKHCVFGEVIKGFDVVRRIEGLETGSNEKPTVKVQIVHCGEMVKRGEQDNAETAESSGCKMDDEPRVFNWLMRRSRSPEDHDKRKKDRRHRDRSPERRRRNSRERSGRSRRSRSRSNDRDINRRIERREERRPIVSKDGVKVKGRGRMTFLGARLRSRTPPHWRKEEFKKESLETHQKKKDEEEERKKQAVIRERKEAAEQARNEKERKEREFQRELDRQKAEAQRELERQEREENRKRRRSRSRSSSAENKSDQEDQKSLTTPKSKSSSRRSASSARASSSSSSSSNSSSSGSSSGSDSD